MDTPPAANLRSKSRRAMAEEQNGAVPSTSSPTTTRSPSSHASLASTKRQSPFVPTRTESLLLALFPVILVFGTIFSVLSPQVRRAEYDPVSQAHAQHPSEAPSYFARKSNIFNVFFVKRGWFWATTAFAAFVLTHPLLASRGARVKAAIRWGFVTTTWILVTQWCFGAPLIDRSFRWTGGRCEVVEELVQEGEADLGDVVSSVACKAAGGAWMGGHDISGHVFLLVLTVGSLLEEVAWVVARYRGRSEERSVVMRDGAIKSAKVEADPSLGAGAERSNLQEDSIGLGGKFALGVVGLSCWMLLMTAIYFHTWFEKLTGLLSAFISLYAVYILPRFVPALRDVVGLPGV